MPRFVPEERAGDISQQAIALIKSETFVRDVRYYTELDSTSSRALQIARAETPLGGVTLVLAERQTAGRGRGESRWWSGPGALAFSVLLPSGPLQLSTSDWPKVSLVAGLAVGEAIEQFVAGETTQLKWPNDVYLRGRKASGILVEGTSGERRMLVIGIGVNVNNSLADAPLELAEKAIAVRDVVGRAVPRSELLLAILQRLQSRLEALGNGDGRWQQDWRTRCLLTSRSVRVKTHSGQLLGICRGIDQDGALLVETRTGIERCLSGVVAQFDEVREG